MARIPFTISDSHGHVVSGLLFLEDPYVVFEVRVQKWGLFKQPVEEVKAEFGVIDSLRFEPGLFKDSLYLVPKRSDLLTAIPGDHEGELRLRVAKRYRAEAQQFVFDLLQTKRDKGLG